MRRIIAVLAVAALVTGVVFAQQTTHEGVGEGYNGEIRLQVTVEGDNIVSIEVISHSETPGLSDPAFQQVTQRIIDSNSTEVDGVSGATATSEGIKAAVEGALSGR